MFEEQQLDPARHNRKAFSCGVPALDRFLQQQAYQTMRRGVSQTFVVVPANTPAEIAGFYALAPVDARLADLQPADAKPLPAYPVPCFRMGAWPAISAGRAGASALCCWAWPCNAASMPSAQSVAMR